MKTYLITGGYGFIGSNYILSLVNSPENFVINLDSLTYASNLKYLEKIGNYKNYHFIKGDICDEKLLDDIFTKYDIDYVVHFAAESHVDRSYTDKETFVKTNVYGTLNLLDTIKKYWKGKENKRFIYISTDEIYGSSKDDKEFLEFEKPNPSSPYAYTKTVADLIASHYAKIYDLPIIVLRPSNNFGINQHPEKLIPKTLLACYKNEDIAIHGSGKQTRDFLSVNDNIRAINLLLEKGDLGETYNVCAKNEISVNALTEKIIKYYKNNYNKDLSTKLIFVKDRENQDFRYNLNCDKIKELGFTIKTDFESELYKTLDYYIQNIDILLNAKN